MRKYIQYPKLLFVCFTFITISTNTTLSQQNENAEIVANIQQDISAFIDKNIRENYNFHGLATYYNNVRYYVINAQGSIVSLDYDTNYFLNKDEWFVSVGRFKILAVKAKGLEFLVNEDQIADLQNAEILNFADVDVIVYNKNELAVAAPELDIIRYSHLWSPLAQLSIFFEFIITQIHNRLTGNWAISIIVFALLMRITLLPVSRLISRFQRQVSEIDKVLKPKLIEIKKNYDGEEAHNLIMNSHKDLGVSPFYALKPLIGTLIQIPLLIAIFNALGEMSQFGGVSFNWIANLAYPDGLIRLPTTIPFLGDTLNISVFLMTLISLSSILMFKVSNLLAADAKRKKNNLLIMSVVFFFLFYPFPSVMLLYWALANLLQILEQRFLTK